MPYQVSISTSQGVRRIFNIKGFYLRLWAHIINDYLIMVRSKWWLDNRFLPVSSTSPQANRRYQSFGRLVSPSASSVKKGASSWVQPQPWKKRLSACPLYQLLDGRPAATFVPMKANTWVSLVQYSNPPWVRSTVRNASDLLHFTSTSDSFANSSWFTCSFF